MNDGAKLTCAGALFADDLKGLVVPRMICVLSLCFGSSLGSAAKARLLAIAIGTFVAAIKAGEPALFSFTRPCLAADGWVLVTRLRCQWTGLFPELP